MSKKILTLLMAAVMVLAGCGSEAPDSSESSSEAESTASVKRDYNFSEIYKKQENPVYVMQFEPIPGSRCDKVLSMDIIEGYDADWLPESKNSENFSFLNEKDNKIYATASFYTAPNDLEKYYGTTDREKILDEMKSSYFPVMDIHDGLLKNSTEDFGYRLVTDWTGKFGDYDYFLIEFEDDETNNHAIRFRVGNSKMDEDYWLYTFMADVPIDNQKLIDEHKTMLFSLMEQAN